eukprot:3958276-Lingulodinium_polyedra.AAC.1
MLPRIPSLGPSSSRPSAHSCVRRSRASFPASRCAPKLRTGSRPRPGRTNPGSAASCGACTYAVPSHGRNHSTRRLAEGASPGA